MKFSFKGTQYEYLPTPEGKTALEQWNTFNQLMEQIFTEYDPDNYPAETQWGPTGDFSLLCLFLDDATFAQEVGQDRNGPTDTHPLVEWKDPEHKYYNREFSKLYTLSYNKSCEVCSHMGSKVCPECNGVEYTACEVCKGARKCDCPECNGSGMIQVQF